MLKTLKKLSFHDKFDFNYIYTSNDTAVKNILQIYNDQQLASSKSLSFESCPESSKEILSEEAINELEIEEVDIYPSSVYRLKKAPRPENIRRFSYRPGVDEGVEAIHL